MCGAAEGGPASQSLIISEHIPTPYNLQRISEHVSHASGSAPCLSTHPMPMPHAFRPCSKHFPNIFRLYAAHFGTFGGLSLVGCPRLPPRRCIVSRVCGGPQPRLRRPSATTPVILGPSGTSRSRQATCVALLVMFFDFSKQQAEECVQAHPCSKVWKFDDYGGTLRGILDKSGAVLRQQFRLKRTRRGRPRRRPARATHG